MSDERAVGLVQIREFVTAFSGTDVQQDWFVLPEGSTAADFAYFPHSDIGDGFLHGHDARSGRQTGSDRELAHRDVVEVTTTN